MFCPTATLVGAETDTPTFAAGVTVVETLAELFVVIGSVDWLGMLAEFEIEGTPAAVGITTMVSTAWAFEARLPMVPVTVPLELVPVMPPGADAETNVTFAGSTSVIATFEASLGPKFTIVIV